MKLSDLPTRIQLPFGASAGSGYIRTVPVASQIGVQDGAASFTDGFPPLNFLPVGAGGVPPFGQDMNGLLNQATAWTRWQATGAPPVYDATFSAAVGGYPKGSFLSNASTVGQFWISQIDDNTSNPDSGGANWIAFPGSYSRNRLLVPVTVYVNPSTGNDSNPGTLASPFATLNKAYSYAQGLDLGGQVLTVSCAAGTYAPFTANGPVVGMASASSLVFLAAGTANLTTTVTSGFAVNIFGNAGVAFQGPWVFSSPNITGGNGGCLSIQTGAQLYLGSGGILFGAANTGVHIASQVSGVVIIGASYGIQNVAAGRHMFASQGSIYSAGNAATVTLTGTPSFSVNFAEVNGGLGYIGLQAISYSGTAVGTRYSVSEYGWINTYGGGANFLPGNAAGSVLAGSYT